MCHYILHIPHASTIIPNRQGFNTSRLQHEINLLTDWETDKIFDIKNTEKLVVKHSRVFCDVERLPDDYEPMYAKGMGICYTHTDDSKVLRRLSASYKQSIIDTYYHPHHQKLTSLVQKSLNSFDKAYIVDCHSFSNKPLRREFNQSLDRPDICLGVDEFHTPEKLLEQFRAFFIASGFRVAINMPYIGTMVPLPYYQKEKNVTSIMIEINKRLYMDETELFCERKKVTSLHVLMERFFRG